ASRRGPARPRGRTRGGRPRDSPRSGKGREGRAGRSTLHFTGDLPRGATVSTAPRRDGHEDGTGRAPGMTAIGRSPASPWRNRGRRGTLGARSPTQEATVTTSPDLLPMLARGRHRSPRRGACFMELASYLAGERWSDAPACTDPSLAGLARMV